MSCIAYTTKGNQCTKNAKANSVHCQQHSGKQTEPWKEHRLPAPNKRSPAHKIRTLLNRGPKKGDGKGIIYIYYLKSETWSYWKIGRTSRTVEQRMKEWSDFHGETVVLHCYYTVEKNQKFVERLIHLYLSYCRLGRIPYTDDQGVRKMHTTLVDTAAVLHDGQQASDPRKMLVAKHKLTEWFCEDISVILHVVDHIVAEFR